MTYSLEEKKGEQYPASPGGAEKAVEATSNMAKAMLQVRRPYYLSSTCAPASSS